MTKHRVLLLSYTPQMQQESRPRLAALCGVKSTTLTQKFDWRSLLPEGGIPVSDVALARAARVNLRGRTVVLLGHMVARAFGLKDLKPFTWTEVRGGTVAYIPQPTPLNHWYQDDAQWLKAKEFMDSL